MSDSGGNLVLVTGMNRIRTPLDRLLRPRSIALIGASATAGSLGDGVLLNLENAGFAGELYLVNPKRPLIRGRASLGSIEELPSDIDCAVLAIPGKAVLEATAACALKNFGSIIIYSAGFAESGEEGRIAQDELARLARERNIAIEGPNCLGIVNYAEAIPLTFVVTPPQPRTAGSSAAILSQSGALAAVAAVNMRHHGIQLSYSISTGNEACLRIEDFLDHLLDEEQTSVFALIVEQFRAPKKFLDLARRARQQGKYIVLLHPGSSNEARASAATHTGALAGDYEVMSTLVTHAGVVHVESLEELVDVVQILTKIRQLPRKGPVVFTESGAFKALVLDLCDRLGLVLPHLSPTSERDLRQALPPFIPPTNPLDLTAQGLVDPTLYRRTLPLALNDEGFGSALLAIILTDPVTTSLKLPPIIEAIGELKEAKPVIFAALDEGAPFDHEGVSRLRKAGVPCFPSPERALRALARVTEFGQRRAARPGTFAPIDKRMTLPEGSIVEHEAKSILRNCGIPFPSGGLAHSVEEAASIAGSIGYPVVLKAQAKELPHKSDAGGVLLNIEDDKQLHSNWDSLHESLKRNNPALVLDGVLVETMAPKGLELIVGARNDPEWGPVLLAGSGGIFAEAIHDLRLMPPDLSLEEIAGELEKLRCAPLLRGFRGSPALDGAAVAQILFALGRFVRSHPEVEEVDINPVVALPKGSGALALDALMRTGKRGSA